MASMAAVLNLTFLFFELNILKQESYTKVLVFNTNKQRALLSQNGFIISIIIYHTKFKTFQFQWLQSCSGNPISMNPIRFVYQTLYGLPLCWL